MKSVGVREFKDQANALLNAEEPLLITRHGQAIGTYIPFRRADKAAAARAAERLEATLNTIYAKTGMTEDEFMAIFLDDTPSDER